MRVIEPHQLGLNKKLPKRRIKPLHLMLIFGLILIIIWLGTGWYYFFRALPVVPANTISKTVAVEPKPLAWPAYGQAAVGAEGYGILADNNSVKPQPTASVAKVITALAVLEKFPLSKGQQGPTLTMTASDVQLYQEYLAQGGSVVAVTEGEKISLYQALQALLLPSANNMADTLVRWAFGTDAAYVKFANEYVQSLGMSQSKVVGASGFSAETVSTARDLVILGQEALKNPVVREISSQASAILPVEGEVRNVNWLLNQNGVNGIKTGNTEEAGGCFLVSATRRHESGQEITIVAAIMGAPSLGRAISDSRPLLDSAFAGFASSTILEPGEKVGSYSAPWGPKVYAQAKGSLSALVWQGIKGKTEVNITDLKTPAKKSQNLGTVTFKANNKIVTAPVILSSDIHAPPIGWRLKHLWQ